ncbi:low temperature requirement protein A [Dermacoccus abyssi]|nr:low temperature requirement protein A [Dermacoccus abyssi]
MSENSEPGSEADSRDSDSGSVGKLELFFDLVFVYAMAQLTELVRDDVSWRGLGHGVLGLLAVWWAWVCYTWLTNTFTTNRVVFRCLVIAAMAAMLLAASALPTAFSTGALVFGLALLAIRVIHLVLFVVDASHDDEHLRAGLLRLAPSLLIAPVLIAVAAFPAPYRELLWIGAAIIDFGGPLVAGVEVFRVVPSYFVERHGLIIIIALGEAVVGLGTGASEHLQQPVVLAAAVLGVLIAASLWWTYFGLTAGAEQRLKDTDGPERARLARDAYSYLHLPLVIRRGWLGRIMASARRRLFFGCARRRTARRRLRIGGIGPLFVERPGFGNRGSRGRTLRFPWSRRPDLRAGRTLRTSQNQQTM